MNCLYITLFFNIVAGIFQTFIKSWNQLLYPRVIEVCRLLFEPRHDFFLHLVIAVKFFSRRDVSLGEETSGKLCCKYFLGYFHIATIYFGFCYSKNIKFSNFLKLLASFQNLQIS